MTKGWRRVFSSGTTFHGRTLRSRALTKRCGNFLADLKARLGHGNSLLEIDVLDGIEQPDAFLEWALKGLPSRNQPHPARAFVDDSGLDRFFHVAFARRSAARVDESGASHETVRKLVASQVDRIVRGEGRIH